MTFSCVVHKLTLPFTSAKLRPFSSDKIGLKALCIKRSWQPLYGSYLYPEHNTMDCQMQLVEKNSSTKRKARLINVTHNHHNNSLFMALSILPFLPFNPLVSQMTECSCLINLIDFGVAFFRSLFFFFARLHNHL